jgi:WD40 repeat protein
VSHDWPVREVRGATCAAFSRDGTHLAIGTDAGEVLLFEPLLRSIRSKRVFDVDTRSLGELQPVASWTHETEPGVDTGVVDLVFSPDGTALALACADRKVRFLRVGQALEVMRPPLVVFPPLSIDWSADGTRLLVVGREGGGAFRLHDLVNDRQVALEVFHAGNLTCGEFSPDGSLVLSGSLDGTVYVRSSLDGTPVARLVGHGAAVLDASFSRDEGPLRVISASADGTARVWPVDPLPAALARKPRELDDWERRREARLAEPLRFR